MKILISGGTGLIGKAISRQLLQNNHEVRWLTREPGHNDFGIKEYGWDPDKEQIDTQALEGIDSIINLAGAPLNERWTPTYKSEIIRSRVDAIRLLHSAVQKHAFPVKKFISVSAVDYYPNDFEREYNEEDAPGKDFLSLVCQKWEQEAQNFENLDIPTIRCRIGIVLSNEGGALPELAKPARFGLAAPLGSGKQWMPWIHIDDVAGIFLHLLTHAESSGVYNVVGPNDVTNKEITESIAKVLHRPRFLPRVPKTALKLALGEMAIIVLTSHKVSNDKIAATGYTYYYPRLEEALQNLLQES